VALFVDAMNTVGMLAKSKSKIVWGLDDDSDVGFILKYLVGMDARIAGWIVCPIVNRSNYGLVRMCLAAC
jgi:hypothetical protein